MARKIYGGLPEDPIFAQLLQVARQITHVVVHDPQNGVNADYAQLLTDVLQMQTDLRESLPRSIFGDNNIFLQESSPYIFILSDGNYEFIVGAFSVLSIGGAVVPLCAGATGISPEEVLSLMQRCHSTTILAGRAHLRLGKQLREYATSHGVQTTIIPIPSITSPVIRPESKLMNLNPAMKIAPDNPGLLLFTSGTSGPPKGVVHARKLFYEIYRTSGPSEVFLHHRPPNWVTGALPLFRHPLAGARMEITSPTPSIIWNRLQKGGVTMLIGPPRFWGSLMSYFQSHIAHLPLGEVNSYVCEAQRLRTARVGGTMPHYLLLRFWREEIGLPLQVSYGATELGGRGLRTTAGTNINLERCVGRPQPSVTVRLSNGDHGELQIKNPVLFTHYLCDEMATRAAFTDDGYYRTGDLAHCMGEDYVFDGRAGEFIKYHGHKISILELEMRLLELHFISDACVLPVTDATSNERVAAVVRLQSGSVLSGSDQSCLKFLREQLAVTLPRYMLPTALRVLRDAEEIPRTVSLKVLRRKAAEQYFALSETLEFPPEVERWDM